MMNILVIGGTGTVGSEVVKGLLQSDRSDLNIRIMTRSQKKISGVPDGTKGVIGNLNDKDTLKEPFQEINRLFLITTPESEDETQSGLNAVEAAQEADIKKIVYMSAHKLEALKDAPHFQAKIPVEDAIKSSGISYTLLRPNGFFQNDYWFQQGVLEYGVYGQPLGDIGLNRVDVRDIADAAVKALLTDEFDGNTYPLVGLDVITGEQTASLYSKHLDQPVTYTGDDLEAWAEQQRQFLPERIVEDLRAMYSHFLENGYLATEEDIKRTRTILGKQPRSYKAFVRETVSQWQETESVS
jgi:uncharacterized protein YbjT (DUF2867 family)